MWLNKTRKEKDKKEGYKDSVKDLTRYKIKKEGEEKEKQEIQKDTEERGQGRDKEKNTEKREIFPVDP